MKNQEQEDIGAISMKDQGNHFDKTANLQGDNRIKSLNLRKI
jgi:hypothetical protein